MFFEDIGFKYLGPVDGHNIEALEGLLKISKQLDEPVLIHVLTKKGKGYKIAEQNPDKFHATGPFDIKTGKSKKPKSKDKKGETVQTEFERQWDGGPIQRVSPLDYIRKIQEIAANAPKLEPRKLGSEVKAA